MIEKRLHQKQVIFQGIFITDFWGFLLPKKQESQTDEFKVATAKTQQSGWRFKGITSPILGNFYYQFLASFYPSF